MDKTKFVVFRNGGIVKENEKVYYQGEKISISPYYKYLGVLISSRLCWSPALRTLALQSEKAMNVINKLNYIYDHSFTTSSNLFDKCVLPIILYGSEIWGANVSANSPIKHILLKFCRQQLWVGSKTPSPALLGECGRHRMYVYCFTRCIKYWVKLLYLPEDCLLKSCYKMLYNHANAGRQNWVSNIKNMLYRFGYGYIWEAQLVENPDTFLSEFKMRVTDCDMQSWHDNIANMPKLRTYILFKDLLIAESYLFLNIPQRIRSYLAKFRIGVHDLEIEVGRHQNKRLDERLCKLCLSSHIIM